MSLKQEIETWVQAMDCYDKQDYTQALQIFSNIADTSKILFNCGVIHATLGEHDRAVDCYQRAIQLDQYLAVAYFQEGVSNFLVGDFDEALANFNDTLLYLRGNTFIDYEQLGLKFKLYSCEVLFNRGLCYMYLQQQEPGMQDFQFAIKEKMTPDHDVIDEAIKENAEGYTVFSIPVGIIYKPNEAKVKNLKQKDYLGRARLVATANASNVSTGFQGADRRAEAQRNNTARDDRPTENISFAATNMVNKNITSRRDRDQSAPPAFGRPTFPPTPPPENDNKQPQLTARTMSMRNNPPRNLSLSGMSNGRTNGNGFGSVAAAPKRTETFGSEPGLKRSDTMESNMYDRLDAFNFSTNGTPRTNSTATSRMGSTSGTPRLNTNTGPSPMTSQGSWSAVEEKPRLPSMRSMSETRKPSTNSRRPFESFSKPAAPAAAPKPLFAEQGRRSNPIPEEAEEAFDDVYAMYGGNRGEYKRTSGRQKRQPSHIPEEVEGEDTNIESDSADDVQVQKKSPKIQHARQPSAIVQPDFKKEMKQIRIKVKTSDDIRYITIKDIHIGYDDFESKVRQKFDLKGRLRMRTKDEYGGDMVTMGDQDDLDTLVASAKDLASQENSEIGRIEVWIQELPS